MTQAVAFFLSVAIEAVAAAAIARASGWSSWRLASIAACVGTVATHPMVWRLLPPFAEVVGYWYALAGLEIAVVLVEGLAYRLLATQTIARALVFSAIVNSISLGLGMTLYLLELA